MNAHYWNGTMKGNLFCKALMEFKEAVFLREHQQKLAWFIQPAHDFRQVAL